MEWRSVRDIGLSRATVASRLAGEQARNFDQRGRGGASRLFVILANTGHLSREMATRTHTEDMAKSNLFLAAFSRSSYSTLAAARRSG
jgi:hypothetical protein